VKIRNGTLKYILKKAVRGVIPDDLIDRKKQGFGVPIHEWLLHELGSYARKKLEAFVSETDLIDGRELQRLWSARGTSTSQAFRVWSLLNFVMGWEHYIAAASCAPAMRDAQITTAAVSAAEICASPAAGA